MSYILDALKKAEAERSQGDAPAPRTAFTLGQPSYDERLARGRRRRLLLVALPLALIVAAAWLGRHAGRSELPPIAPEVVPEVAQDVAPTAGTPAPATAPAPAAAAPVSHTAAPAPAAPERPVLRHSRPAAAPHARQAVQPTKAKPVPIERPGTKATPPPTATLHDLPPEIRSRIPSLATSGFLYSGNPADRTVLLNNRLLHEGDEVAPGLTLERLLPNGMVLNYEGHRFRSAY